jgi:tRNA(fMet)-specific endonuclease VapC
VLQYLLDTDTAIYVIKRRPIQVFEIFRQQSGRMAISSITLSELLHGAEKSERSVANLAVVEDFCSRMEVLAYGSKASQHYGSIRAALERAGTPIGVNDLHIAAHARSEGLTLVTNNEREFVRVPALQMENWLRDVEKKPISTKRKPPKKALN